MIAKRSDAEREFDNRCKRCRYSEISEIGVRACVIRASIFNRSNLRCTSYKPNRFWDNLLPICILIAFCMLLVAATIAM